MDCHWRLVRHLPDIRDRRTIFRLILLGVEGNQTYEKIHFVAFY